MKLAKGAIFFFLMSILGSCFNPPEFPIVPQIGFKSIEFVKVGGFSDPDSLILTISFKDGDGDLGVDPGNDIYSDYPYNPIDYFLAKDGDTIRVATEKIWPDVPSSIRIEPGQTGKLVTVRTRNDPDYSYLPEFDPSDCTHYNYDSVYVSALNKNIFDASYNLVDSFYNGIDPTIYVLLDTFLYDYNPNHYNIKVIFEIKNNDGSYTEFDWRKEVFCSTLDGRFPILNESLNKVPLDGTLRYAMNSIGFSTALFSGKTMRLKVQIKDRALHPSNTIITPDFKIE